MGRHTVLVVLLALFTGADGFVPSFLARPTATAATTAAPQRSLQMVSAGMSTMDVLQDGIKAVAVGVSGSKPIPEDLVSPLIQAIGSLDKANADVEALERLASFLGTLFVKNQITETDEKVLAAAAKRRPKLKDVGSVRAGCSAGQVLSLAGGDKASADTQELALKLLSGETLDEEEAYRLGKRIFDVQQPSTVLCLCVQILRVRYESPSEWRGLIKAQQETLRVERFNPQVVWDAYQRGKEAGNNPRLVVQLAEPFDGMDRGELLTPLLAQHLQNKFNVVAVSQCGRSSGPKYGQNLLDIATGMTSLSTPFVHSNSDIERDVEVGNGGIDPPEFGWYVDQQEISLELDAWVDLRRNIIKRPFLATSEKFINTCGASVLVVSAFHPSYAEKMMTCAETATDFKGCMVVRKGLEGSLGFGLARETEIVCGVRQDDGSFEKMSYTFGAKDMGWEKEGDLMGAKDANETIGNIKSFSLEGSSGDEYFDKRVKLSSAGLEVGMKWIMARLKP
ncbi:unnamed protein product [Ectocarpus sp. CCAP 1310/34]|nr:unnamed protein product [Ectocarpus sp. CCAP 1310/34]